MMVASLDLVSDPLPLRVEEGGVIRIGRGRVSLDLVVEQYESGMSPEDMVRAYDALALADVYHVLSFYLRHTDEVRAYLTERKAEAGELQRRIEEERPRIDLEELRSRVASKVVEAKL